MLRRRFLAQSLGAAATAGLACGCGQVQRWFGSPSTNNGGLCRNNLRNLATAILRWEVRNGRKLPPYVADDAGKPLLSWRVLILPEMDRVSLFNVFRLDEPWDSPHNLPLALRIRDFICPSSWAAQQQAAPLTNYFAVTGENTFWSGDEFTASTSSGGRPDVGLLLVESNQSAVVWSEPKDLHVDQLQFHSARTMSPGLSSGHTQQAVNVALTDVGVVQFDPQQCDTETLGDLAYRLGSPERPEKRSAFWLSAAPRPPAE